MLLLPSKKWLGVNASKSLTSELTGVKGLAFNVCSTILIVVERTSSVTDLFPNTAYIAFLQLLTNRSPTPPKWGAAGGLNFHLIPRWIRCSSIPSLFHAATYSANSLSAPTKFVPLSLTIVFGLPLRAINLIIALRQLSVSNLGTTSICTALIVRQVKRQHHRFSFLRPIFTMKGPKCSTPTFVKAVEASSRSSGRPAITGAIVCALPFLQVMNLFLIDLKALRMPRIHIFCWTMFLTCSVPSCWLSLCSFPKNNSTAWCFQCSKIGCFALKSNWLLPILSLARISPSSSRKGCWYRSHVSTVKHQLYLVSQLLDWPQTLVVCDGNCVSTAIL